jgi:para-nitrobenzyl esterase
MTLRTTGRPRGIDLLRRTVCRSVLGVASAPLWLPLAGCDNRGDKSGAASGDTATSEVVAETSYGKIRGTTTGPVKIFKGVPYGADTSTTRFMPSKPPEAWAGVREATSYGAQAPQPPRDTRPARQLLSSWAIPQENNEDCLFLNIWTPALRDGGKRPVMFYIHGGGFSAGSGAATVYDGTNLAQQGDVVVVTVNHRLNIFGYLYLAELGGERYADSGNVGQHDLIAALRWIRDNVGEFGGDPDNVLVFGESGGGAKICALLAMPDAAGLFHRAVVESGPMIWAAEREDATATAHKALELLGLGADNLDGLNSLTTAQLLKTFDDLGPQSRVLAPVVDGRGLPRHPFDPDAPMVSANIPLLIGFNSTETTFVLSGDPTNFTLTWAQLPDHLKPNIGSLDANEVVTKYRQVMPDATPSDIFFDVTTEVMMTRLVLRIADRKAALNAAPVYLYELAWETPADGGKWKSPHTLEIPLVFDNVAAATSTYGGSPEAQLLADQMSAAWLAFARSGNPGTSALPDWPAYDAATRPTMTFNVTSQVINDPMGARVAILGGAPYWNLTK